MKLSTLTFTTILIMTAQAQMIVAPNRLRALKRQQETQEMTKAEEFVAAAFPDDDEAMSMPLFEFANDFSMSMADDVEPVKCDKRCQKDKINAEKEDQKEAKQFKKKEKQVKKERTNAERTIGEWGATEELQVTLMSMSLSMAFVEDKCNKRCQKDKIKAEEAAKKEKRKERHMRRRARNVRRKNDHY